MARYLIFLTLISFSFSISGALSATFTLTNNCDYTVWPGLLSNAGTPELPTTGFSLEKGETQTVSAPTNWSGRMWARTLCSSDPTTGNFVCSTGDCGSGKLACSGGGAAPPATLAEFTLAGSGGLDFYDVSLVDGYNLPVLVVPRGGSGNCSATGCLVDLNGPCPSDLKVLMKSDGGGSDAVACRSACEAYGSPQYCCSGAYGNPNTQKSLDENPQASALPLINNTMVYLGGQMMSNGGPLTVNPSYPALVVLVGFWTVLTRRLQLF
ncbi:Thaumatin-like protein 1 [Acorus calamus]|uniref:Thaumatin-like protein 1 n=1 Tax=Acorus calamus TaxID=4465 RepID=A0AAV9D3X1_ACOCL|nr:Thaumatin-like protein 1 [Acorus calamus]